MPDAVMAAATRVRWHGRLVWIPPSGEAFFVDTNPKRDMTTEQLAEFMRDHAAGKTGDAWNE